MTEDQLAAEIQALRARLAELERLASERERAAEAALTLAEVGRALTETLDPAQAADRVVSSVRQLFRAHHAALFRLDHASGALVCISAAGAGRPESWIGQTFPFGTGLAGLAVAEARPLWSPDLLSDARITLPEWTRERLRQEGYRSVAGAPLIAHGKVLGALTLYDTAERVFLENDLGLLSAFADQAALALENARMYAQAEQRQREAERLAELVQMINASLDLGTILRRITEAARELCECDVARIALRDPASGAMAFRYEAGGRARFDETSRIEPGKGLGGMVLATGRPLRAFPYAEDPRFTKDYIAMAQAEGVVAVLAVPIRGKDRIEGLLYVGNRSPRPFTDRDEALLVRLAEHAAIAMENARLYTESEADRRAAELSEQRLVGLVQDVAAILWEASLPTPEDLADRTAPRRFSFVSHQAEVLLGYPVDRWLASPGFWPNLIHPEDRDRTVEACTWPTATLQDFELDYRVLAADGRMVWLRDIVRVLRDAQGRPWQLRGVMVDITMRKQAEAMLRESEERLKAQFDGIPVPTCIWQRVGEDFTLRECNAAAKAYTRGRIAELLGSKASDLYADEPVIAMDLSRCFSERTTIRHEMLHRLRTSGEHRHLGLTYVYVPPDTVMVHWEDITASKRAAHRQALQFSVTRALAESRTLQEATSNLLYAICRGMRWEVGELWLADPGADRLRLERMWYPRDLDLVEFEASSGGITFTRGDGLPGRVWASGQPLWVTDVLENAGFRRRDLAQRFGLHAALAFPIRSGNTVMGVMVFFSREAHPPDADLLALMNDIGSQVGQFIERKQAEEERTRLASAVEQAAEDILITSADGTIVHVNPAFERHTGYSAEEAIGRTPRILKSGKHDRAFYENLWRTIRGGGVWRGEMINRCKDGTLYVEEKNITPVRDERGNITHFVSIGQDVTARKELERALYQAQKIEAMGRLAGGVAHDFNNLLSIILGYSDAMVRGVLQGELLQEAVKEIKAAADRGAELTRQLLAFSRRQVLQPRVADLNGLIAGMERLLRRLIGEDLEFITLPGHPLGKVKADPAQLERAVMNLVLNARDAMPQGGRLTIQTADMELDDAFAHRHPGSRPGPHVMLSISDTGRGMDAEILAQIFDPFFSTKEPGKGTGLGLPTVWAIVKQHQGYIDVISEPGRGTTFRIFLPRVETTGEAPEAALPSPAEAGGSETILLVEDDPAVRELIHQVLSRSGYTILAAADGSTALQICHRHRGPIHLLLTDVVMPQMSGLELARRIAHSRPQTRVLYVSGYTDNALSHRAALEPGGEVFAKPFAPDALLRKVREVLDAPRT